MDLKENKSCFDENIYLYVLSFFVQLKFPLLNVCPSILTNISY